MASSVLARKISVSTLGNITRGDSALDESTWRQSVSNSDGLDFEEFCEVARKQSPELTDQELRRRFDALDTDKSGQLSLHEFAKYSRATRGKEIMIDRLQLVLTIVLFVAGGLLPMIISTIDSFTDEKSTIVWTPSTRASLWGILLNMLAYSFGLNLAVSSVLRTMVRGRQRYLFCGVAWISFLHHAQEACTAMLLPRLQPVVMSVLQGLLKLSVFALWVRFLDALHKRASWIVAAHTSYVQSSKPITKWQAIAQRFAKFGEGKEAQDEAYRIGSEHQDRKKNSPEAVLCDILGYAAFLGKLIALALLLLDFLGVDLFQNIVFIGLSVLLAALWATSRLSENVAALVPMALTNPFYVGEIISLSLPGAAPADSPKAFLTGFVEGVTWTHVCIRDFKKKQTFVPLPEFQRLTIANWTRRPNKLCYWYLTVSSQQKDGTALAALARFVRQWIKAHEEIDQKGYTKAVVKGSVTNGLALEVVFYPNVGSNVHKLRAEFVVALMEAARLLKLTFVPAELHTPFPEDFARAASGATGATAEDENAEEQEEDVQAALAELMPSEALAAKAGYDDGETGCEVQGRLRRSSDVGVAIANAGLTGVEHGS